MRKLSLADYVLAALAVDIATESFAILGTLEAALAKKDYRRR
jgi:hypothetical protein